MHILFLITGLLGLSLSLAAQSDIYGLIAEEICGCMEQSVDLRAGDQARACLTTSINAHREELRKKLALGAGERISQQAVLEQLLAPLAESCPVLETTSPMPEEVEYRWSDNPSTKTGNRIETPKLPSADPAATTTAEAPAQWRASGRLLPPPGKGLLALKTPNGETLRFELPGRVARSLEAEEGAELQLLYRREWRTTNEGGVVVKVVTGFE